MLRKSAPASSMQKTYDECYLICSTAIYFEGQVRTRPRRKKQEVSRQC